jgi:membrane-bound lytic murein transglycosylase A
MFLRSLLGLSVIAILSSCSTQPEKLSPAPTPLSSTAPSYKLGPPVKVKNDSAVLMYPTEFADLPGWSTDNHLQAFHSFKKSCEAWSKQPDHKPLAGIFDLGTIGDWKRICHAHVNHGQEKQFFEHWFKPYAVANNGSFDGLFTGYYVPELHGSFHKTSRYHVPIYGIPKNLITRGKEIGRMQHGQFVPFYDREAIVAGALKGQGAELLWVDSEVDAFFLEVQGSGRVIMENGHVQGLGYAGKNGRGYYAIGKSLVDRGIIAREDISMQSIRNWITENPDAGKALMLENASYVFFKLTHAKPDEGPVGSMHTPLTAQHSLAVDKSYLPMGVPLWLDADHPTSDDPLRHLVMAQDTGGAIKGLIRGDFFWGQGTLAGEPAGVMKSKGRYFILVPKHLKAG